MKRMTRVLALVMAMLLLSFAAVASAESENVANPGNDDTVYLGIVAAVTGVNRLTGELNLNGAQLAVDEINANGGILGKKVELVVGDEIDNMQASVNATNRLLNDERVSAIIGTNFSQNVLAVIDAINQYEVPYIACGSNELISQEGSNWVYQPRNFDALGASIIATYAYETLGIKNPAILYSTIPNCVGPAETSVNWYKDNYDIEIPDSMQLGYAEEETNFAPIIAQIGASGADGLIHIGNQQPTILISRAFVDAGLTIPRLTNATNASTVVIDNAGAAANGWYCTADWAPQIDNPVGQAFQEAYYAKYGKDTEMNQAVTYDSVYLLKTAMEAANTTTDRNAINQALQEIDGFEGVLGTYKYHDDHSYLSEFYMCQITDGEILLVDRVKYR